MASFNPSGGCQESGIDTQAYEKASSMNAIGFCENGRCIPPVGATIQTGTKSMERILPVCCFGLMFCLCGLAQSSPATNMQLVVQVRTEAAIAWRSENLVQVKVRLASGNQVKVWMEDSCGSPSANGHLIAASGTYTIPLSEMDGFGSANVCLASTHGRVRSFLPVLSK